jgi:hypothetical protein
MRAGVYASYIRGGEIYACTSLPIAQINPASSRAMAVTATVNFLPRCDNARYRLQSRVCALAAMSRTAGGTRS